MIPPMNRPLLLAILVASAVSAARPASADVTAFIGAAATPSNRPVRGFAAGAGFLVVGFEFEYANAVENLESSLPALQTGMGNVYVQNPVETAGMQFYATIGGGLYRERLGDRQETAVGTNVGGGVKITLAGPLRLRLDYRLFTLGGDALHRNVQRIYAGLTLGL